MKLLKSLIIASSFIFVPLLSMQQQQQQSGTQDWKGEYYKKNSEHQVRAAIGILDTLDLTNARAIGDLGCGTGQVTNEIASRAPHADVIGIDPSEDMIKVAAQNFKQRENLRFVIA